MSWEKRRAKAEKHHAVSKRTAIIADRPVNPRKHKCKSKIYAKVSSERKRNQQSSSDTKRKTDVIRSRKNAATLGRSRAVSKPPPQRGSKRSRRLAGESAGSHEEGTKEMNNLIAYLRITRSWMEFRVSTRHGSGIATYGYFPSSIASFIRSGTISQRTVLDHGKLGVHYALDWSGSGGLKEMIDTFGEDYSPYPTEEMMEFARVPEWEFGDDDLPWRDVEEADDKLRKQEHKVSTCSVKDEDGDTKDILFVANILASLSSFQRV